MVPQGKGALQNVVKKLHTKSRAEVQALARTVERGWDELQPVKLENVYRQWKLVLDLIIEDKGGNAKVETKRGKPFCAPLSEAKNLDQAEEEEAPTEAEEIAESELAY